MLAKSQPLDESNIVATELGHQDTIFTQSSTKLVSLRSSFYSNTYCADFIGLGSFETLYITFTRLLIEMHKGTSGLMVTGITSAFMET